MLESLDTFDWHKLQHAYGSAKDVPGYLRALLSEDPAIRQHATEELINSVNHQGTIYSATAPTVTFLLEILSSPHFSGDEIWQFLYIFSMMITVDRFAAHFKHGIYEIAVYQSLCAGKSLYLAFLNHPAANVRALAAHLLGLLPDDQMSAVRLRLWRTSQAEVDPYTHAMLLIALGNLIRKDWRAGAKAQLKAYQTQLAECALKHPHAIVRLGASLAWARHIGQRYQPLKTEENRILQPLIHLLIAPDSQAPFWWDEIITDTLLPALTQIGTYAMCQLLQTPVMTSQQAHQFAHTTLKITFRKELLAGEEKNDFVYRHVLFDRWTPKLIAWQADALRAILQTDAFWSVPTNLFSFFYGLPDSRAELAAWVKANS